MRPGKGVRTGVLLDTMVVRPVLVPAFLILMVRWRAKPAGTPSPEPSPPLQQHSV